MRYYKNITKMTSSYISNVVAKEVEKEFSYQLQTPQYLYVFCSHGSYVYIFRRLNYQSLPSEFSVDACFIECESFKASRSIARTLSLKELRRMFNAKTKYVIL